MSAERAASADDAATPPAKRAYRTSRVHAVRPRTISRQQLRHLRIVPEQATEPGTEPPERPRTRGECRDGPRPCPWVSCRHHLYLDVTDAGGLKLNRPDLEPHELEPSCSLDLAALGQLTLEQIAPWLNLTRERVRQIEQQALRRLRVVLAGWRP